MALPLASLSGGADSGVTGSARQEDEQSARRLASLSGIADSATRTPSSAPVADAPGQRESQPPVPARTSHPELFLEDLPDELFLCEPEEASRFGTDACGFMLFQFSLWFRTQSMGKAGVTLEHDSTLQGMSKEEMLDRVRRKDPELLNKVWAFSRSMRDTPAYWHEFYKRVLACCEQWPPHCYIFWKQREGGNCFATLQTEQFRTPTMLVLCRPWRWRFSS